jgi:hypothetical protein
MPQLQKNSTTRAVHTLRPNSDPLTRSAVPGAEAYKLLDPHHLGLLDVAREYLEDHKQRSASVPFGQLFDLRE